MMLALCGVLYAVFFGSLGFITQHGSEVKVPMVVGNDLGKALSSLEAMGFEVEVDSTYEPTKKALLVLNQQPEANAIVKQGRTVFITVNKAEPPTTPMPNLVSLSYRSAIMILKSNRLLVGDTTYRPDIAKGAILEQLLNGKPISAGTLIPQGSRISLVIGDGLGNTEFAVPDVIGMTFAEGREMLMGNGLLVTPVFDPDVVDTANAVIFNQTPSPLNEAGASNRIREGDYVDIFIKQNPTQEEMERNRNPASAVNSVDSTGP
jgi:beta-lactam-binding protein with PASTA domain